MLSMFVGYEHRGIQMHVPAPVTVEFRRTAIGHFAVARAHGAPVSDLFIVSPGSPSFTVYAQWARAFLEAMARAPIVAGAR